MLQAAIHIHNLHLDLTVLNYFNSKDSNDRHAIPNVIVDQLIKLKPNAVIKISGANTANSILEEFHVAQLFISLATVVPEPVSYLPYIPITATPGDVGIKPIDTD